jgi:hypothetical protein
MQRKWKKIEGDTPQDDDESTIWKPDNADEWIVGKYFDLDENIGLKGDSNLYHIRSDDGTHYKVWGSMILDDLMSKVNMGSDVKIVYKGKKQGKNNFYKLFEVSVPEGEDGDEGGESSPSSSKSESKPSQKRKPVAGKLRFEANGIIKDMTATLSGREGMIPGHQDMKNEIDRMFDDHELGDYEFKPRELHLAVLQILDETFKEYEDMIND